MEQPVAVPHAELDLALRGELDGVADEIHHHLPQPGGVAEDHLGHRFVDRFRQRDPLGCGLRREQDGGVVQAVAEVEGMDFQLELAGLDLGKIEDVVDEHKERVAALLDRLGVVALGGGKLGVEHQVGEADDAVHGRAQLVADHGQEGALGAVGLLGRLLGLLHLLLRQLARGDVGVVDGHAVAQLGAGHPVPARRIPARGVELELGRGSGLDHRPQLFEQAVLAQLRVGGDEVAAEELAGVFLQELFRGRVDVVEAQVAQRALLVAHGGEGDDAIDGVEEDARLLAARLVELIFEPLARGHVAYRQEHAVFQLGEDDLQPLVALGQLAPALVADGLAGLHGVDHAGKGAVLPRLREIGEERAEMPAFLRLGEPLRRRVGQDALEIDDASGRAADRLVGDEAVVAVFQGLVERLVPVDQVLLRQVGLGDIAGHHEPHRGRAVRLQEDGSGVELQAAPVGMGIGPCLAGGLVFRRLRQTERLGGGGEQVIAPPAQGGNGRRIGVDDLAACHEETDFAGTFEQPMQGFHRLHKARKAGLSPGGKRRGITK